MEWTVVTVLIALVGLGAAVMKPMISLNSTIVKLTGAVEALQKNIEELTDRNSKSHDRIFSALDDHGEILQDHEKRITLMEHDK